MFSTIDLNWLIALAACAALVLFWFHFKSSRGLMYTVIGCAAIIGAVLTVEHPARMAHLAGVLVVVAALAALFVFIGLVIRSRRRRPRYQAPARGAGRCSECGEKSTDVRRTVRGWLCDECAEFVGSYKR